MCSFKCKFFLPCCFSSGSGTYTEPPYEVAMEGEVLSNPTEEQLVVESEVTTASTLTLPYETEGEVIQSRVSCQQTKRIKMQWASHSSLDATNTPSSSSISPRSLPDLRQFEEHEIIKGLKEHQSFESVRQIEPVENASGNEEVIPITHLP
ncbi:unnamed protein product [Orchesella dallaii]|uniref:Uncharacterized protein n=1 Tax=Orchesella dallaii TaxID=48710 RepID=A0ABP1S7C4_9HEXA